MSNLSEAHRLTKGHGSKQTARPKQDLGGYSSEVPPLPIPNREVKLTHADGTAYLGGRVGSRLFKRRMMKIVLLFLFYISF